MWHVLALHAVPRRMVRRLLSREKAQQCNRRLSQPASSTPALPHGPPTGAVVLPRFIEDCSYGGRTVHTVLLFPSPGGWGQATALRLKLEASAAGMFDIATFGSVYVRAVSAAYMVRGSSGQVVTDPAVSPCTCTHA